MKTNITMITLMIALSYALADKPADQTKNLKGPPVDFFQEEITLIVNDSISRVEGVYHIKNNYSKDINMPMTFPFYVDSVTDFPHIMEIYYKDSTGTRRKVAYRSHPERKVIRLSVPIKADSSITWYLNYEQRIKSKRAVYIITSTSAWSKPLDQATYTYIAPADFEITEIWPVPDTSYGDSSYVFRRCVKYDFLPSREMEINWK